MNHFNSFSEFYPFYLSEHRNSVSRRLHFIGTLLVILLLALVALTGELRLLVLVPVLGYGFAWTGHYFFEKNRPATFQYPLYSLLGYFRLFWDLLTGRLAFQDS